MTDEPLVKQLSSLRSLLEEVDTRLARAPVAPPPDMGPSLQFGSSASSSAVRSTA